MTKFDAIKGRWEDTCEKHLERGNMLIDLVNERGCIEIVTFDCGTHYYLHKSVKYPDGIQLTEFWADEDEIVMLRDEEIYSGYDLCEITYCDFAIVA